jgi:hypothetical protein
MTVEDEGYEVELDGANQVEEGGDDALQEGEQLICGIIATPAKILLAKDMSEVTKVEAYQDGANVDAWIDRGGDVFVLIDNGNDICSLEAEEFELLEGAAWGVAISDDDEPSEEGMSIIAECIEGMTWEAEALTKIRHARIHVAEMEAKYLEAKERAKDAKADWEAAVNQLTEVIDTATKPMPLFDQLPAKQPVLEEQPVADDDDADTRDRWRAIPIDEIFTGIKGMGKVKRYAIRDAIPTLGDFEDLRKKASLDGSPLREYMPKGIGQEACDQLEEAALNRISQEYGGDDDGDGGDDDDGGDGGDVDDDDTD